MMDLKSGLLSPGQFYMKYNPDITDEGEAEKALFKNLKKLREATGSYPELDEALNTILGVAGTYQRNLPEEGEGDKEDKEE